MSSLKAVVDTAFIEHKNDIGNLGFPVLQNRLAGIKFPALESQI